MSGPISENDFQEAVVAELDDHPKQKRDAIVKKIYRIFTNNSIDLDAMIDQELDKVRIKSLKSYEGFIKNSEGDPEVVPLMSLEIFPDWAQGPQWPLIATPAPVVIKDVKRPSVKHTGRVTVLLPDPQIGYRRYSDDTYDPIHDETAMATALELIRAIQPHRIVNLGDFLDNAWWSSKFVKYAEFGSTTNRSLARGVKFLTEQKAYAPDDCEIILIEGNHDDRLELAVLENNKECARIAVAGNPANWPVFSVPNLLDLDRLGVQYVGGYPAGNIKIADAHGEQTPLYAIHGKKLDMVKQAKEARHSTVQGHCHHDSFHAETHDYDGSPRQVQAHSLGCLCRVDGAVPGTNSGSDPQGRPILGVDSWQHAIGVVTETEYGWQVEHVQIHDGVAQYRDKVYGA